MSAPMDRPKRKNPVLRTRSPLLPPGERSRIMLGMTAAAARGVFALQECADCGKTQYPPREACGDCLGTELMWREQSGTGELITHTVLRHSHDPYFLERMPWRVGLVRLDRGPSVVVHVHGAVAAPPSRVRIIARLDKAGQAALIALPEINGTQNMADDKQMSELTCDPRSRKVLVTDGKSAVGQALVRSVVEAGADLVWVGYAEPWKAAASLEELRKIPQVSLQPLDVTDSQSVQELAAQIGGRVDILINNAELHRTHGIATRAGTDVARAEMDVNYFGLLRLAQAFAPAMHARGADGRSNAVAWVNLLSIFALSNYPPQGTFSASKAAAYSLSQCLRAQLRPVRVINVFPGPIDDEWNQPLPPPKLSGAALARAIVRALQEGIEDVYPGDVAQDWFERWRQDAKVLERELSR